MCVCVCDNRLHALFLLCTLSALADWGVLLTAAATAAAQTHTHTQCFAVAPFGLLLGMDPPIWKKSFCAGGGGEDD